MRVIVSIKRWDSGFRLWLECNRYEFTEQMDWDFVSDQIFFYPECKIFVWAE